MSKLLEHAKAMEARMEILERESIANEKSAAFWRELTNEYISRMRKVTSVMEGKDLKAQTKVLRLIKKARALERDGDPKNEMKGLLCELEMIS